MIALPAKLAAAVAQRSRPLDFIHLFDIQLGNGAQFFWSSHEGVFPSRLTGGLAQYKPWIKDPPTIKLTRSLQADGGQFTVQNLSGNTIDRDAAALFKAGEFEGAYVVYRRWYIPADAAPREFHGFLTEQSVGEEDVTLKILQLFQPNEVTSFDQRQTRDCPWRFTSAQCGHRRGQLFLPLTAANVFSANTIGATALALMPNLYAGEVVMILSGTGAGQEGYVQSHNATTFTMRANWTTAPDATSKFLITGPGTMKVGATTATIFGAATIGAASLTRLPNQDIDGAVFIVAGAGAGQNRAIAANSATTFTVAPNWTTPPDATSVFVVVFASCAKDLTSCIARGVPERFAGIFFLQPAITTVNGPTGTGTGGNAGSTPKNPPGVTGVGPRRPLPAPVSAR